MIKALAPRMRRGCSWVWLSIVLAAWFGSPSSAHAQEPPKTGGTAKGSVSGTLKKGADRVKKDATRGDATKKDATKGDAAKKDAGKAGDNAPPAEEGDEPDEVGGVEVFKDPRAEQALKIFKSVPGLRDTATPQVRSAIRQMAAGAATPDSDTVQRFVQGLAYDLTQRSYINGLVNPAPGQAANSRQARAIQDATESMIDALNTAKLAKNSAFLNVYVPELVATLPKLLDNNLVPRTEAMIVLGQTGSPAVVPIFLNQLRDPNQTVQVKLWAARGLAMAVDQGARTSAIPAADAINAGKTISDFLEREKDTLWFLQMRSLEALGAMRQAAVPTNLQKADMATTAMKFLANPDARPEVRASAAWAMGMLQVPSIARYNFPLVAYDTGRLAAEIGEKINASFTENPVRSNYLAGLLVTPIYQTFNGLEGARESGLLHAPGAGASQSYVSKVADLTSSVTRAAVELVRAPGGQVKDRQKVLSERVAALKAYLDKNPPKDFHLVPGGPEFRTQQAQVADAPAEKRKLAGAPGGQ